MAHKLRYHPDNCTFIKLIFNKLLLLSTTYFPFSMPLASISAAAALFYSSNFSYKIFFPSFMIIITRVKWKLLNAIKCFSSHVRIICYPIISLAMGAVLVQSSVRYQFMCYKVGEALEMNYWLEKVIATDRSSLWEALASNPSKISFLSARSRCSV